MISLTSISSLRLEQFRTQHELARNFYDDQDFCPVYHIEEVSEHRDRIQRRTSSYPSPTCAAYYQTSSNSSTNNAYFNSPPLKQDINNPYAMYQQHSSHKTNVASMPSISSPSYLSIAATRAIPIIDPSNMTPVSVPAVQYQSKVSSGAFPSIAQWTAYTNNTANNTSPAYSHSSINSLNSSSSSISSSSGCNNQNYQSNSISNNTSHSNSNVATNSGNLYFGSNNYNTFMSPHHPSSHVIVNGSESNTLVRGIPIIDPATRQVFCPQQTANIVSPGFYNVSVY